MQSPSTAADDLPCAAAFDEQFDAVRAVRLARQIRDVRAAACDFLRRWAIEELAVDTRDSDMPMMERDQMSRRTTHGRLGSRLA